jgi:hypothetical protein
LDYEQTREKCIENKIPLESFIEITKSENNTISGNFTLILENADCSSFTIECVVTLKGTFTDLKAD